jgi:hypothetical protein
VHEVAERQLPLKLGSRGRAEDRYRREEGVRRGCYSRARGPAAAGGGGSAGQPPSARTLHAADALCLAAGAATSQSRER